jgi:hypothetical protein
MCVVFGPCTAGELLKWNLIVVFPFINTDELAGVPCTVKSLASTVPGSAAPLTLTVNSVGAVSTTMLPQSLLVTEQSVGVDVSKHPQSLGDSHALCTRQRSMRKLCRHFRTQECEQCSSRDHTCACAKKERAQETPTKEPAFVSCSVSALSFQTGPPMHRRKLRVGRAAVERGLAIDPQL